MASLKDARSISKVKIWLRKIVASGTLPLDSQFFFFPTCYVWAIPLFKFESVSFFCHRLGTNGFFFVFSTAEPFRNDLTQRLTLNGPFGPDLFSNPNENVKKTDNNQTTTTNPLTQTPTKPTNNTYNKQLSHLNSNLMNERISPRDSQQMQAFWDEHLMSKSLANLCLLKLFPIFVVLFWEANNEPDHISTFSHASRHKQLFPSLASELKSKPKTSEKLFITNPIPQNVILSPRQRHLSSLKNFTSPRLSATVGENNFNFHYLPGGSRIPQTGRKHHRNVNLSHLHHPEYRVESNGRVKTFSFFFFCSAFNLRTSKKKEMGLISFVVSFFTVKQREISTDKVFCRAW